MADGVALNPTKSRCSLPLTRSPKYLIVPNIVQDAYVAGVMTPHYFHITTWSCRCILHKKNKKYACLILYLDLISRFV